MDDLEGRGGRHRRREWHRSGDRARARPRRHARGGGRHRGGLGRRGRRRGARGSACVRWRCAPTSPTRRRSPALADAADAEFGTVHVLCNNAGVLVFGAVQDLKVDDWRWVLGVNVFGVLNGVYTFLPRMLERGEPCHIVNTASIASLAGNGVYGVSKAAILNITETMHGDLAGTNVGVTALMPGMLNTKIVAAQRNRAPSTARRRTSRSARSRCRSAWTRSTAAPGCARPSSPASSTRSQGCPRAPTRRCAPVRPPAPRRWWPRSTPGSSARRRTRPSSPAWPRLCVGQGAAGRLGSSPG